MLSDLIIARLKAQVPALHYVGRAVDLTAAQKEMKPAMFPAAFVLPLSETGGAPRYMTGVVAQKRTAGFSVVLVVRNLRDLSGAAASSDIEALRQLTDAALFGWVPDATHNAMIYNKGAMICLLQEELWWQDEYSTSFDRR